MASKRNVRKKMCSGKDRYSTLEEAQAQARLANKRTSWINAYHCKSCGGYHIGHAPRNVRQAMIARQQNKI